MADRKISDLTALTTPAAGDYLPIVDISEPSNASKNKRITIEELLRGAPDGTAAAPGIAFESDPDSGLYSAGANALALATNGTGRLFVDSSGNVGIGTASGGNTVHMKAPQGLGVRFENTTSSNSSFLTIESGDRYSFNVGGTGYYTWTTGGSEKLRLDNSGRLLVGTSTYSGNSKLAVSDSSSTIPVSYGGASEVIGAKCLNLGNVSSVNQLRITFTLPTNITGYEGFFVAELLVKASFDNASFPALGGIYKIRVGGVSSGASTATSFLTTEVLYTASSSGNWTAIATGDVAVNAVSGTELTLDIDNPGGADYRYNVFSQFAHNCSSIALSSVAA